MRTLPALFLSLSLAAVPALAMAQQNDPNAPAQNTTQLNSEAQANRQQANTAKAQEKRASKAAKADKKAAKKEQKAAKDQQKAADANANAQATPQ